MKAHEKQRPFRPWLEVVAGIFLVLGYMVSTSVHTTFAVWIFFLAVLLIVASAPLSKIVSILFGLVSLAVACWLSLESARKVTPPLTQVLQPAITSATPQGRPYIVISNSNVEALNATKPLAVTFELENTGSVELKGYLKDFSCRFSYFLNQRYLRYLTGKPYNFALAPREKTTMRIEFAGQIVDEDKIKLLKEKTAELFVFGRGEYWDEAGNKYPLSYCRRYDDVFPSQNLVFCEEGITFTEPTYNDQ